MCKTPKPTMWVQLLKLLRSQSSSIPLPRHTGTTIVIMVESESLCVYISESVCRDCSCPCCMASRAHCGPCNVHATESVCVTAAVPAAWHQESIAALAVCMLLTSVCVTAAVSAALHQKPITAPAADRRDKHCSHCWARRPQLLARTSSCLCIKS